MTPRTVVAIALALACMLPCILSENDDLLTLPDGKKMKVCDNMIVDDIPGKKDAVLAAARKYVEQIHNNTIRPIDQFDGHWKWEVFRVMGDSMIEPPCNNLHVFGNERTNYDEAKRFCYFGGAKPLAGEKCVAYSIGSNNVWNFEEYMHADSDCTIETFDCTCNMSIPEAIQGRTRAHPYCLGPISSTNDRGEKFMTLADLNKLLGREKGPDYYKMDIEGYEWAMMRALVKDADLKADVEAHLPLQVYAEWHLDRESLEDNSYVHHGATTAHVGRRLRHFFDEMFLKGGYMIMHMRVTVQTRNTDMLLTKILCHVHE